MKALVFTANGGPEAQKLLDLPRPVPGRGQLLVAVRAAGANPADWKRRTGFRRPGMPDPQFPTVFALTPQVTATFPLERAQDALREVEPGHARGKIVILGGAG